LILFVLASTLIFGLLALEVDLGYALLSRQEMQAAADSSALEGLRYRDESPLGPEPTLKKQDGMRRAQASLMTGLLFDDDLFSGDMASDEDPFHFGAGPVVQLLGGLDAKPPTGPTIKVPKSPVYKPRSSLWTPESPLGLELNGPNLANGDMVSGIFDPTLPDEEGPDYSRMDFLPSPEGSSQASLESPSFLVRLRRTRNVEGLDDLPGVSSAGPPVPFFFGHGPLLGSQPGSLYRPRRDGLTVRSTAIATARNVLAVGVPEPAMGVPMGATSFGLKGKLWVERIQKFPVNFPIDVFAHDSGFLTVEGRPFIVGRFLNPPFRVGFPTKRAHEIRLFNGIRQGEGYVPIFQRFRGKERIVGFGRIFFRLGFPNGEPDGTTRLTIMKLPGRIVSSNVSAIAVDGMPAMSSRDRKILVVLNGLVPESIQAPALAR